MTIPIGAILIATILVILLAYIIKLVGPTLNLPPAITNLLLVVLGVLYVVWLVNIIGFADLTIRTGQVD